MSARTARAPDPPYLPDVDAFESGAIEAERFDHAAHVHVAWRYLEQYPLAEAFDPGALLKRHYSRECLASERARRRFVLPDRSG